MPCTEARRAVAARPDRGCAPGLSRRAEIGRPHPFPSGSALAPQCPQLSRVGDKLPSPHPRRESRKSRRLGRPLRSPGAEAGAAAWSSPRSWHPAWGERGGGQRGAAGTAGLARYPPRPSRSPVAVPVPFDAARSLSPARCSVPGSQRGCGLGATSFVRSAPRAGLRCPPGVVLLWLPALLSPVLAAAALPFWVCRARCSARCACGLGTGSARRRGQAAAPLPGARSVLPWRGRGESSPL